MKVTNKQIINSIDPLKNLSSKELDVKTSFIIAKNIKAIDAISDIFISEKMKLVKKYGTKDKEGNLKVDDNGTVEIAKGNLKKWNRSLSELLEIENEIDIKTININNLDVKISAQELLAIDFMIEE